MTPSRARHLSSLALLLLPFMAACKREKPMPATTPAGQSWLSVKSDPDADGAIGYLDMGGYGDSYACDVALAKNGHELKVEASDLVQAPFVPMLAEGDMPAPAVFAIEGDRALVSTKLGWAWLQVGKSLRAVSYEQCLDGLIAEMNSDKSKHPMQDGWSLHDGWLLNLEPQSLSKDPSESSPLLEASIPDHFTHWNATWQGLQEGKNPAENPSLTVSQLKMTGEEKSDGSVVMPLRRQGDWLQVMLPAHGRPIYVTDTEAEGFPGLLVTWDPQSTGWVRWRKPARLPGTSRLQFSASYWGYAD